LFTVRRQSDSNFVYLHHLELLEGLEIFIVIKGILTVGVLFGNCGPRAAEARGRAAGGRVHVLRTRQHGRRTAYADVSVVFSVLHSGPTVADGT
jgi:hypothetical protein